MENRKSYTIEDLARLLGVNEASIRHRIKDLGVKEVFGRYTEEDMERVKTWQAAPIAPLDREVTIGAAATRLRISLVEAQELTKTGELRGMHWEGMGRYAGFVTVSEQSLQSLLRKRQEEAARVPQESAGATEPPAAPIALLEPDRPFLSRVRAAGAVLMGRGVSNA